MRGNRRQTNQNRLKNIIIEFIKENIKTYLILTIIFFIGLSSKEKILLLNKIKRVIKR